MKRITIFAGNYGSGKTELSLNTALKLRAEGKAVTLADIDIVNPYFRSAEHKAMLEEKGIRVVMPQFANTAVDIPALPPELYGIFEGAGYVVADCGGDPAGATALGTLKTRLSRLADDTEVFFVFNAMRPFQETAQKAYETLKAIENAGRIKFTAIINNTNLASETAAQTLLEGQAVAEEFARLSGLEVAYVSGVKPVLDEFLQERPDYAGKTIELTVFTRPYWL